MRLSIRNLSTVATSAKKNGESRAKTIQLATMRWGTAGLKICAWQTSPGRNAARGPRCLAGRTFSATRPKKLRVSLEPQHAQSINSPSPAGAWGDSMRNELKAATFIYSFDEGSKEMAALLGNKGAHLAEMTRLGLPVPPAFTITTAACTHCAKSKSHPAGLREQLSAALAALEKKTGKKLGDEKSPLLLSVRSGAAVSMPGMMDTVLNIGLTEKTLAGLIAASGNERFARDCYRRLLQMFGNVVLGIRHEQFETLLSAKEQLLLAVNAVFGSWGIPRARAYRDIHGISHDLGTAVNVQSMVFGNFGDDSATGVVFTRDPATGENGLYGEYLPDAQGEDVVAGIRTPQPIAKLAKEMPAAYKQLDGIAKRVERHYREMQDMEFTVERGTLYVLQTRSGKRTAQAAVRIAVEMEREGMLSRREALLRVSPEQLEQLMHKRADPKSGAN